jgi:hypothetical protein
VAQVEASVVAVKAAIASADRAAIADAIGRLKPPYARLFVKHG